MEQLQLLLAKCILQTIKHNESMVLFTDQIFKNWIQQKTQPNISFKTRGWVFQTLKKTQKFEREFENFNNKKNFFYTKYTINYNNWNKQIYIKKTYKQIIKKVAYKQIKRTKNLLPTHSVCFSRCVIKLMVKCYLQCTTFFCMLLFYW